MVMDREGRRLKRMERRRKEILEAAARLFAAKGYRDTTIADIAEAVAIAEATLYHYFGSKRKVLLAVFREIREAMDATLPLPMPLRSRQDLIELTAHGYRGLVSRLSFARALFIEAWFDDPVWEDLVVERFGDSHRHIREFVARQIEEGAFRSIDLDLATSILIGAILMPLIPVLRGVRPPPTPEQCGELAESVIDLAFCGLLAREERATHEES